MYVAGRRAHAWDGLFRLVRSSASLHTFPAPDRLMSEATCLQVPCCSSEGECRMDGDSSNFGFGAAYLHSSSGCANCEQDHVQYMMV